MRSRARAYYEPAAVSHRIARRLAHPPPPADHATQGKEKASEASDAAGAKAHSVGDYVAEKAGDAKEAVLGAATHAKDTVAEKLGDAKDYASGKERNSASQSFAPPLV